jgi:hypothetical protein
MVIGTDVRHCGKGGRKGTARKTKTQISEYYQNVTNREIIGLVLAGLIWLTIDTCGGAIVNMLMIFRVAHNVGKFLSCCTTA